MTEIEQAQFASGADFDAAILIRRWDDAAKVQGLWTPPLQHFEPALSDCRLQMGP